MNFLALLMLYVSASIASYNIKQKGLLWGTIYGDAFGGPYEFQSPKVHPLIFKNKKLTHKEWKTLEDAVFLKNYHTKKSTYGAWTDYASPGTITDDTRHKIIYYESLKNKKLDSLSLAKRYIFYHQKDSNYKLWLNEYVKAAYYRIDKNHPLSYPKDRLWGGMSTQAGQMIYLLNALNYIGKPTEAYLDTYKNNIFDNGDAMDFTSAIVAGLSHALLPDATWDDVLSVMEKTDPLNYKEIPFVPRKVSEAIKLSKKLVYLSNGNPRKLFSMLNQNLKAKTWWEADIAFILAVTFLEMTKNYPLSALELVKAYGKDTDSYAQVIGAFLGALYGESIFNQKEISLLKDKTNKQYNNVFKDFL